MYSCSLRSAHLKHSHSRHSARHWGRSSEKGGVIGPHRPVEGNEELREGVRKSQSPSAARSSQHCGSSSVLKELRPACIANRSSSLAAVGDEGGGGGGRREGGTKPKVAAKDPL